ncbi:MAG: hypothetical protein QM724_00750 [Flavobacteriales bacterium]
MIRTFRPDVIITRFAPDRSAGHGHHEASAILAQEAFDLAGDPKAFPEQLQEGLDVWQPRRLFFNGSTWWKKDLAEFAKTDADWSTVDVGGYDPLLGLSYTELAGRSRSMHKSQGFGAAETRGEALEYLKFVKGDRPKGKDIFEGIDMTWGRVKGGSPIGKAIDQLINSYDLRQPSKSLDQLRKIGYAMDEILSGDDKPIHMWHTWEHKRGDQQMQLELDCMGAAFEVLATSPYFSEADSIHLTANALPRTVSLPTATLSLYPITDELQASKLQFNNSKTFSIRPSHWISEPFWLAKEHGTLYDIPSSDIGWASRRPIVASIAPKEFTPKEDWIYNGGLMYKWIDRVAGERIRPVYVTPVASVIPKANNLIARGGTQTIEVEVEALTDSLTGTIRATLPSGWEFDGSPRLTRQEAIAMQTMEVNIAKRNERQSFRFQLMPMDHAKAGAVKFEFTGPKGKADRTLHEIDYPHIMPQVYYTPAEVKLVPLDVKTTAKTVGYIKGAGDDVPQAIEQLGVKVDIIDASAGSAGQLTLQSLKAYDAIVVGIRAYNIVKPLKELNPVLKQYVEEGGTLVVQYNTTPSFGLSGVRDMVVDPSTLGPYPFTITRDRVTVEEAPPTFLDPKHPLLNTPNKITMADFDGWVQERGLYFLGDLNPHYTPLIAWNDPGEQPLNGGLVTCDYGKGRYVYTGIELLPRTARRSAGRISAFCEFNLQTHGTLSQQHSGPHTPVPSTHWVDITDMRR